MSITILLYQFRAIQVMRIGVIGISFKTACLEIREQLSEICEKLKGFENFLGSSYYIRSCVVLNTCNRTEIYYTADSLARAHSYILSVLRSSIPYPFEHLLYAYFGFDSFFHLAKVTAGVDSAVVGETEIQGQVKKTYEITRQQKVLCSEIHYLFQKSLMIGKTIRRFHYESIDKPSFERVFWRELTNHLENDKPILFVGASQVNARLLKFKPQALEVPCILTNRTEGKGLDLICSLENVEWMSWSILSQLDMFSAIIVGTASHSFVIDTYQFKNPVTLFDLSLPRNINPKLGLDAKVTLHNIDDLHKKVMGLQAAHDGSLKRVHQVVADDVKRKFSIYHAKQKRESLPNLIEALI